MNVVRWKLQSLETGEIYTVEINPNQASSYIFAKSFEFAKHDDARMRGVQASRAPQDWSFGGVVRSKSYHDALIGWERRPGKIRVTDHLGRTFEVMVRSLDLLDRRPSGDDTWRFTYTFNFLMLRRIT